MTAPLQPEQFDKRPYIVVTQHEPDRRVRRKRFDSFEEADHFAATNNPDTDGSMVPNVDEKFAHHPDYEKGHFWPRHENRYAVILRAKPKRAT